MDAGLSATRRISFIVRIVSQRRGPLAGIVERIGTGEKHRFEGVAEMGRIIQQSVAEQEPRDVARPRRRRP